MNNQSKITDDLQIILITYNRAAKVERTFQQLLAGNSPVKKCEIIVLDNNSTDSTANIVSVWQKEHSNIRYFHNRYNVGANGNIVKAMEIADKKYFWIMGDDDNHDFSNWQEVERAMADNEKIICISRYAIPEKYKEDPAYHLFQLTFVTAGIYSTDLLTDTIMKNAYDNIYTLFPHLTMSVQYINECNKIYVVNKAITDNGCDPKHEDYSYIRGANRTEVFPRIRTMCWIVGYCNILTQLKDKKLKERCIEVAIPHKHIYGSFNNFFKHMKSFHDNDLFIHFIDVYTNIAPKHRKQLKLDYEVHTGPCICDIGTIYTNNLLSLILARIKSFIFNIHRTEEKRYITLLGIHFTMNRHKK